MADDVAGCGGEDGGGEGNGCYRGRRSIGRDEAVHWDGVLGVRGALGEAIYILWSWSCTLIGLKFGCISAAILDAFERPSVTPGKSHHELHFSSIADLGYGGQTVTQNL